MDKESEMNDVQDAIESTGEYEVFERFFVNDSMVFITGYKGGGEEQAMVFTRAAARKIQTLPDLNEISRFITRRIKATW